MFAAHFAVGLAIGARARRAPMPALLAGAFLPDIVWIGLAAAGVEPFTRSAFFDGWSHSVVSVLVEAAVFALCFAHKGVRVWLPVWLAVMSHVVLDVIYSPQAHRALSARVTGRSVGPLALGLAAGSPWLFALLVGPARHRDCASWRIRVSGVALVVPAQPGGGNRVAGAGAALAFLETGCFFRKELRDDVASGNHRSSFHRCAHPVHSMAASWRPPTRRELLICMRVTLRRVWHCAVARVEFR